jgi:hypothetical protein
MLKMKVASDEWRAKPKRKIEIGKWEENTRRSDDRRSQGGGVGSEDPGQTQEENGK